MSNQPSTQPTTHPTSWKWWYLAVVAMLLVDILFLFYLTNRYQ